MHDETAVSTNTPCRYFYRSGSCRRGDQCKFSHNLQRREGAPSVLKKAKPTSKIESRLNPASAEFKPRQPSMVTVIPSSTLDATSTVENSKYEPCGICTEVPSPFAQLLNCNHYFCVDCLKKWRAQGSGVNKKSCPTCRAPSDYMYVLSEPQKDSARLLAIQRHKERLKQIPCKAFAKSIATRPPNSHKIGRRKEEGQEPFCVFADTCLFAHQLDGEEYSFEERDINAMKTLRKVGRYRRILDREQPAAETHINWLQGQQRLRDFALFNEMMARYI